MDYSNLHITWQDILDITIVGIIIYWLLVWLRGTRALQLFRGIGVLVLVYILAHLLHLQTLLWVFDRFGAVFIIILVLVFQPELRRTLERVGQESFILERVLGQRREGGGAAVASHIIRALHILSPKKVGALIVIEREISLSEFHESGTMMDSEVTSELLTSIFDSRGPLHDAAVIIQGKRIAVGGCVLPISSEPLDSRFGTRHRAAIGITENTDAIAIVASEETGEIRGVEKSPISNPFK